MKKYLLCAVSIAVTLVTSSSALALGSIDPSYHTTYICRDTSCTDHASINFLPSGGANKVAISGSLVTGYAWGEDLGWINFAPSGSGVTYDTVTGNISGYAWSSASGFINFRPTNSGTLSSGIPVGVQIQSDGSLYGWAFASGKAGGWIKFDCSLPVTCVKIVWTTDAVVSSGSYFLTPPVQNTVSTTTPPSSTSTIVKEVTKVIPIVPVVPETIKKSTPKSNVVNTVNAVQTGGGSSQGPMYGSAGGSNMGATQGVVQKIAATTLASGTTSDQVMLATSSVSKNENSAVVKTAKSANQKTENTEEEKSTSFISVIATSIKKFFSWLFR